jgi:hypothetical protein
MLWVNEGYFCSSRGLALQTVSDMFGAWSYVQSLSPLVSASLPVWPLRLGQMVHVQDVVVPYCNTTAALEIFCLTDSAQSSRGSPLYRVTSSSLSVFASVSVAFETWTGVRFTICPSFPIGREAVYLSKQQLTSHRHIAKLVAVDSHAGIKGDSPKTLDVSTHFRSVTLLLPFIFTTMTTQSDELQVIRRFSFGLTDDNPGTSNCLNLVPIPPAFIRDARYQGDAR